MLSLPSPAYLPYRFCASNCPGPADLLLRHAGRTSRVDSESPGPGVQRAGCLPSTPPLPVTLRVRVCSGVQRAGCLPSTPSLPVTLRVRVRAPVSNVQGVERVGPRVRAADATARP